MTAYMLTMVISNRHKSLSDLELNWNIQNYWVKVRAYYKVSKKRAKHICILFIKLNSTKSQLYQNSSSKSSLTFFQKTFPLSNLVPMFRKALKMGVVNLIAPNGWLALSLLHRLLHVRTQNWFHNLLDIAVTWNAARRAPFLLSSGSTIQRGLWFWDSLLNWIDFKVKRWTFKSLLRHLSLFCNLLFDLRHWNVRVWV